MNDSPMASMLGIDFSTSHWGNKRLSRTASAAVDEKFGGSGSGKFTKYLIPPHHVAECDAIISSMYRIHYSLTLPWLGKLRVIPTGLFFDEYRPKYQEQKQTFDAWLDRFLENYPYIVQRESEKMLGQMFNPSDYPTVSEMRELYGLELKVMPVPTENDFRMTAINEHITELKQDWKECLDEQSGAAVEALWLRLKEPMLKLAAAEGRKRFDNSLVDNISEACRLVSSLNVFNDAALGKAVQLITSELPTIETIKSDPAAAAVLGEKFCYIVNDGIMGVKVEDENPELTPEILGQPPQLPPETSADDEDVSEINDKMSFWNNA